MDASAKYRCVRLGIDAMRPDGSFFDWCAVGHLTIPCDFDRDKPDQFPPRSHIGFSIVLPLFCKAGKRSDMASVTPELIEDVIAEAPA